MGHILLPIELKTSGKDKGINVYQLIDIFRINLNEIFGENPTMRL